MMHVWALNPFPLELDELEKEAAGGHSATASGWGFLRPHFARAYPFFVFPGSWSGRRPRLKNPGVGRRIATEKLGDRENGEG